MFYHIRGTVEELQPQLAVIDCGGVGFAVNTTSTTVSRLRLGEPAKFYAYLYVREESLDLYGFYSLAEKRTFEMLLGVSGVGPKAALSILSARTPEALAMAIVAGDEKALTVAQGIGKKTAQRVILELKDKMGRELSGTGVDVSAMPAAVGAEGSGKLADARAALAVLGYDASEIAYALKDIETDALSVEDIIRQALRKMVK